MDEKNYFSRSFTFQYAVWYLAIRWWKTEGYLVVYFKRESSGPPIQVFYSLGLKTSNNEIAEERHYTSHFGGKQRYDMGFRAVHFIKRCELIETKSELLPLNRLAWVIRLKHHEATDAAGKFSHACHKYMSFDVSCQRRSAYQSLCKTLKNRR